ncbi:MAG: hypothetical protein JXR13_20010 [Thalassovita sp.]
MNYLKCGSLANLLIFLAGNLMAENQQDSFFSRLERPATVSSLNVPKAIGKHLDKLNEPMTVLVPSATDSDPFEADVWLLFFRNESEISSMPSIIQDIHAATPKLVEKPASRYVEFQLSVGGPKVASFHFVENYGTDSEEVIACKAAVAVYSGVIGNKNISERNRLIDNCDKLM